MKDVYDFASANMPADQPGSLEPEQYWNVLAFLLQADGQAPNTTRLDDATGAQVALPKECATVAVSSH